MFVRLFQAIESNKVINIIVGGRLNAGNAWSPPLIKLQSPSLCQSDLVWDPEELLCQFCCLSPRSPGKIQTFISHVCPQFLMLKNKQNLVILQARFVIMAVTTQPGKFQPSNFQTGLFECCDDCGVCEHTLSPFRNPFKCSRLLLTRFYLSRSGWYTLLCPLCVGCSIASDMDECCLCGLGMPIRSVYRTKYNIKVRSQCLCEKNAVILLNISC